MSDIELSPDLLSTLGQSDCQDFLTVVETIFPNVGFQLSARSRYLSWEAMFQHELTQEETRSLLEDFRRGATFVQSLRKLPDDWDSGSVRLFTDRTLELLQKAVTDKKGIGLACHQHQPFARIEPSLTRSDISEAEVAKILQTFHLNTGRRPIRKYLNGEVIAGKLRPQARYLVLIYGDNHMSMALHREILTAFWNLFRDGVRTVGTEGEVMGYSRDNVMELEGYQRLISRRPPIEIRRSRDELIRHFEEEAIHVRGIMEEEVGKARNQNRSVSREALYYPNNARSNILAAMVLPEGRILGLDDERLLKDLRLTCGRRAWAPSLFHWLEDYDLGEACVRYPLELRSHLYLRKLKETMKEEAKEVIFLPFGAAHILSLAGELMKDDYDQFSFLIVYPDSVKTNDPEETAWLERQHTGEAPPFQLQTPPLLQERRPTARWKELKPLSIDREGRPEEKKTSTRLTLPDVNLF